MACLPCYATPHRKEHAIPNALITGGL